MLQQRACFRLSVCCVGVCVGVLAVALFVVWRCLLPSTVDARVGPGVGAGRHGTGGSSGGICAAAAALAAGAVVGLGVEGAVGAVGGRRRDGGGTARCRRRSAPASARASTRRGTRRGGGAAVWVVPGFCASGVPALARVSRTGAPGLRGSVTWPPRVVSGRRLLSEVFLRLRGCPLPVACPPGAARQRREWRQWWC